MTEMTTITFDVPTELLRATRFIFSAAEFQHQTAKVSDNRWRLYSLADAALVEAKAGLPPPRKLVTKDTAWGTPIVSADGASATFIGPHPSNPRRFIGLAGDAPQLRRYDWWFEAEPKPEPESVRVPVEVGQKRRNPRTGGVWAVNDICADEDMCGISAGVREIYQPTSVVEQWEVVVE